jgi:hypothetical protein
LDPMAGCPSRFQPTYTETDEICPRRIQTDKEKARATRAKSHPSSIPIPRDRPSNNMCSSTETVAAINPMHLNQKIGPAKG